MDLSPFDLMYRRSDNGGSSILYQNITIDDTFGDPTNNNQFSYSPAAAWQQGNGCSDCTAQPNVTQTKDGTWHDSTYDSTQVKRPGQPGFTFQFDGVYDILNSRWFVMCLCGL